MPRAKSSAIGQLAFYIQTLIAPIRTTRMPQELLPMRGNRGNQIPLCIATTSHIIIVGFFRPRHRVTGKFIECKSQFGLQSRGHEPEILFHRSQRLDFRMIHLLVAPLCGPGPGILFRKYAWDLAIAIHGGMQIRWNTHGLIENAKIRFLIPRRRIFTLQKPTDTDAHECC